MSQALTTVPAISQAGANHPLDRAIATIATGVASLAESWRIHVAARQIEALDDRALADIGLGHGQAESAARYGRSRLAPVSAARFSARPLMPASFTEWR